MLKKCIKFNENTNTFTIPFTQNNDIVTLIDDERSGYIESMSKTKINSLVNMEKYRIETTYKYIKYNFIPVNKNTQTSYQINESTLEKLGYTRNDVTTRSERIRGSFLRVYYYDSDDVMTQNLLGYHTIFMDASGYLTMYNSLKKEDVVNPLTMMPIEFNINNPKYKRYNNEGFYMYIYRDMIPETGEEIKLYVRFEFNNAINGKVVKTIVPTTNITGSYNMDIYQANSHMVISAKFDPVTKLHYYDFSDIYPCITKTDDNGIIINIQEVNFNEN